jgi:cytochrome c
MAAKYGCTGCRAVDHKVAGPAFKDVAARYRGKDVEAALVETHNPRFARAKSS